MEFNVGDNESGEFKVKAIWDSAVYARESRLGHLLGLYYLVLWKGYPEEENTWEPASTFQHLRKLISLFHKDHLNKPTATSPAINTVPPMVRSIIRPTVKSFEPPKQKQGQPANNTNKRAKKNWATFDFYRVSRQIWISSTLNILNRTTRDYTWRTWLHVTAHTCTWLPANLHQNIYLSTFKSHPWIDFLGFLSLSHKASVFFLSSH